MSSEQVCVCVCVCLCRRLCVFLWVAVPVIGLAQKFFVCFFKEGAGSAVLKIPKPLDPKQLKDCLATQSETF